ncbi:hypothetical protein F2Q68_00015921 [Brassica cretica]|uniref:Reverse transcriptase zinc-binding domain-containing protein n=1 Tax=Brassica cretica TaxID=69181 RepID=A0A8S9HD34_BRACR|nr:hypothetical protein F2Q68_00015921 [Brassica cretica]
MINMWIANYNRLPTRSRLPDWGLQVPIICHFYSQLEETRDHQLLQCGFSRLSQPLNLFNSWLELLSWIKATSTQAPTTLRFCVMVTKSMVQPESHQTVQTGHLGGTSDRGSVQGIHPTPENY